MKMYVKILIVFSFVNCLYASCSIEKSFQIPATYQQPPLYRAYANPLRSISRIIQLDLSERLNNLKKQDTRYQNWTVYDYESELRSYVEDEKLVLSDEVHKAIATCLHNLEYHNQANGNIDMVWQNIAESLQISNSSICRVYAKFQEYQQQFAR